MTFPDLKITLLPRYVGLVPDSAGIAHEFYISVGHLLGLGIGVNAGASRAVILDLRRRLTAAVDRRV